jgi:hypothetical protein
LGGKSSPGGADATSMPCVRKSARFPSDTVGLKISLALFID